MNCIPILYQNRFMLGKKVLSKGGSLDFYKSFDFQAVIKLFALPSFKSKILNVG